MILHEKYHFRIVQSNSWQQCQRMWQIFIMDGMFRGINKIFLKVPLIIQMLRGIGTKQEF